jgi:hypothetical protein
LAEIITRWSGLQHGRQNPEMHANKIIKTWKCTYNVFMLVQRPWGLSSAISWLVSLHCSWIALNRGFVNS